MSQTVHQYQVQDLAEFMHKAKSNNKPFVFFTGAGCSVSAGIPLAAKLIDEMHQRFPTELKILSADDRTNYGKCMAQIGRDDRRQFLKSYIGDSKINWAHIALACLLKAGYIGRVLTFNFDNLLARSCGLLGLYPATYDFTSANLNLYHLIENPAIVHLHGQSHGFAQLNSEDETKEHAEQLSHFVCSTLNESPALFIGYSGNADAFFPQIKQHFSGQHRLFWVDMAEQAPKHITESILTSQLAYYMRCGYGSDVFLIELAQQLGCFPPTIFSDPYQHLLDDLRYVADYPQFDQQIKDENTAFFKQGTASIFQEDVLQGIKTRLKKAQQREKETESANYRKLFLEGKYQELVDQLEPKATLQQEEQEWLARAYFSFALKQSDLVGEIAVYDKLINRFGDSSNLALQERVAKALVNKGVRLGQQGKFSEAIESFDRLIHQFGDSGELALQERVAKALINKGLNRGQQGDFSEEIKLYNQLIGQFGDSAEPALQKLVATALFNKGASLAQQGQLMEESEPYNQLIIRFSESNELALQQLVAEALFNKGMGSSQQSKFVEAIESFDQLVTQFGDSVDPALQESVIKGLFGKGAALLKHTKTHWEDQAQAQQQLSTALTSLQQAVSKSSPDDLAEILSSLSYVEFLLGRREQAETHLREALEKGGEKLYRDTLDDITMHPIPPDTDFQALLERVWQSI